MLNAERKSLRNDLVANIQQSNQPLIHDYLKIIKLWDKLDVISINDTPKGSHDHGFKVNFI